MMWCICFRNNGWSYLLKSSCPQIHYLQQQQQPQQPQQDASQNSQHLSVQHSVQHPQYDLEVMNSHTHAQQQWLQQMTEGDSGFMFSGGVSQLHDSGNGQANHLHQTMQQLQRGMEVMEQVNRHEANFGDPLANLLEHLG